MEQYGTKQRRAGFLAFFISGICAISSGIIVSHLQERIGFDYGMTGTLLALMNIGNLVAGFATGALTGKLGMKRTALLLSAGFAVGYLMMTVSGWIGILMAAFFLVGIGKGNIINTCTILVGNHSKDRTRGMNVMHSCYAMGALLCPFLIAAATGISGIFPMLLLGTLGLCLWLLFFVTPMGEQNAGSAKGTDWSFLRNRRFWLLTGLIFCQNAVEISVSGWMVTYFKGSGILGGTLSTYTVTVMWAATLLIRMMIAFVFPIKKAEKAMIGMGIGCTVFYFALMQAQTQTMAIVLLFAFAGSMAGMNPTAVASAGRMMSVASMGIMLPVASSGAILMPWIIGMVAQHAGIGAGMASIIVPCVGMLGFGVAVNREAGHTS